MRLDEELVKRGLADSRSQASRLIKLGKVKVGGKLAEKPHMSISGPVEIKLEGEKYVSRAAYKLAEVASKFKLDFSGKTVLDVGSSTGGFTDYALKNGAKKVVAVDVGTEQMHPRLRFDERIELHEKTDIRDFSSQDVFDIILIDVSFISIRQVLPAVARFASPQTQVGALLKPQFEAGERLKNKGVIKNDTMRRQITKEFETWARDSFKIVGKIDLEVSGSKGNVERFYLLKHFATK